MISTTLAKLAAPLTAEAAANYTMKSSTSVLNLAASGRTTTSDSEDRAAGGTGTTSRAGDVWN